LLYLLLLPPLAVSFVTLELRLLRLLLLRLLLLRWEL
jgi:hypothetical protein